MNLSDCGDVVTREQAMAVFHIHSWNSLYRRVQKGLFPKPDMERPARWFNVTLQRWMTEGAVRTSRMRRAS